MNPRSTGVTVGVSAFAGALVGAVTDFIVLTFAHFGSWSPPPWGSLTFVFFFIAFPMFLLGMTIVAFIGYFAGRLAPRSSVFILIVPLAGAAVGFALPFAVGLMAGTPKSAAIGGLVGGAVCAGVQQFRRMRPQPG